MPRLPFKRSLLVCACCALFAPAHAAVFTWDGSGTDNNWSTAANWDCDVFCFDAPSPGDSLVFQGSTRLFPFNNLGNIAIDAIRFDSANFSLGGNAFTIQSATSSGGFISNTSIGSQQIGNLLTLNGAVDFFGGAMTFNGGITLSLGSTLMVRGSRDTTFNGVIGGSGDLVVATSGGAAVVLNRINSYNGDTQILSGGTLRLGAQNALSSATPVFMTSGTLDLGSFAQTLGSLSGSGAILLGSATLRVTSGAFSGAISGTGKLVKQGSGAFSLSGPSTYSGGTEILGGTLSTSGGGLPDAGPVLIQGGALSISSGTEVVGSVLLDGGQIGGTGALQGSSFELRSGSVIARLTGTAGVNKTTSGIVTLSSANTYTGDTLISAGTLRLTGSNALPAGGDVTITGGTLNAEVATPNAIGALTLLNGSIAGGGALAPSSIVVQQGSIGAQLAGTAALVKNGPGTVTLSAAQSYSGGTVIEAGTLAMLPGGRLPSASALTLAAGGTLALNGVDQSVGLISGLGQVALGAGVLTVTGGSYSGQISGSGGLHKTGGGTLTLSGSNTYTGQTQVTGGTLTLGANQVLADASSVLVGGSGTFNIGNALERVSMVQLVSGTISGGAGLLESSNGFVLESGAINARLGGPGSLTKLTPGLVTFAGMSSYGGATTITDGTLRLLTANALPSATGLVVTGPGVLDLGGVSAAVGSLSGSGTVALGTGGVLTVGANDQSTTFSGTITGAPSSGGAGGLTKTGAGTLTLTGSNQHTGSLTVQGGTLELPNGVALAGRAIEVQGGTLRAQGFVNRALTVQPGGQAAAAGNLIIGDLSGAFATSIGGALNVGSHTVQLVNLAGASIGGSALLGEGGRLTVFHQDAGITLLAGGTISASGNATIDGDFVNLGSVQGPSASGQLLVFNDDVSGNGSFAGNVSFTDGISIGLSPAIVSMENVLFDGAEVVMELGGLVAGSEHDKFDVSGRIDIRGGVLRVNLIDDFVPEAGDWFDLFDFAELEGSFSSVALPALGGSLFWNTSSLYADGSIAVAIPEPQTYALLLAGLGLFGFAARRRQRA